MSLPEFKGRPCPRCRGGQIKMSPPCFRCGGEAVVRDGIRREHIIAHMLDVADAADAEHAITSLREEAKP